MNLCKLKLGPLFRQLPFFSAQAHDQHTPNPPTGSQLFQIMVGTGTKHSGFIFYRISCYVKQVIFRNINSSSRIQGNIVTVLQYKSFSLNAKFSHLNLPLCSENVNSNCFLQMLLRLLSNLIEKDLLVQQSGKC